MVGTFSWNTRMRCSNHKNLLWLIMPSLYFYSCSYYYYYYYYYYYTNTTTKSR